MIQYEDNMTDQEKVEILETVINDMHEFLVVIEQDQEFNRFLEFKETEEYKQVVSESLH